MLPNGNYATTGTASHAATIASGSQMITPAAQPVYGLDAKLSDLTCGCVGFLRVH